MFGLGKDKSKGGSSEAMFDLEKDLAQSHKRKEVQQRIQARMLQIKGLLRAGLSKDEFNQFGYLLHGYAALLKVVARFGAKG
ncbi:MAG: DUF5398 family protein [Chlamydiales bacterium]|nr:DUF5398 family protein [Chlamydiales bacterium]